MSKKMYFGRYDYAGFLSFICYSSCSIIIPICLVAIANELKFPLNEGGMGSGGALQLGRSIPMVAAMLFCGFTAGRFGKRKTMAASLALIGIGIFLASISPAYAMLFLALAIAGLGEGVIEGLATPFVQDLHQDEPGRYINFTHAFWSVGVFVTVLAAGWLLNIGISWRYITAAVALTSVMPIILMLLPAGKNGQIYPERRKSTPESVVWKRTVKILAIKRFWLFFAAMFLAGGGEFCLTFWCASFIQIEFAGSALIGGIGTAVFAAGMILGRTGFGVLIPQHRLRDLLIVTAAVGIAISLFFPMLRSLTWLLILLFPIGIASAPFWPSIQSYASTRMRVDNTMLFILLSCAGIPGCGFFTFVMGVIGDQWGLRASFFIVPLCYLLMGGLIAVDWINSVRDAKFGVIKK